MTEFSIVRTITAFAAAMVLSLSSASVSAVSVGFDCVTSTSADCAAGESQLSLEVNDLGVDAASGDAQVEFVFINAADGVSSSIAEIVLFAHELDFIDSVSVFSTEAGSIVEFDESSRRNPRLPGLGLNTGELAAFEITAFDAANPAPSLGVNPGETLSVIINLVADVAYADIVDALAAPLSIDVPSLAVGMHVIAFDSGGSESFISTPVPLPASMWLLVSAFLGLVVIRRR